MSKDMYALTRSCDWRVFSKIEFQANIVCQKFVNYKNSHMQQSQM